MGCNGAYAAAWQFASFWCSGALLSRVDDGVGNNRAALNDSQANFINAGVKANVGMILYNLTDGSSGPVTAVTEETITATLTGGTDNDWDNGDAYRIVTIDAQEIATINNYLAIAAADLHSALAASGACDCTLAAWASTFLAKLNIIDAAAYYRCECGQPKLTDEVRAAYLTWMNTQLELIRTGKLELCAGATGAEFPALDWAEQSTTEFAAAQIIFNARNG